MILIVTNERDLTTDYIVLELQRRGRNYVRLNTEKLTEGRVTLGFSAEDDWSITLAGRTIRGAEVTAGYFRRPGLPSVDVGVEDLGERVYCEAEWGALLKSLYMRVGDRWLNSPANIMLAEDKPRQLLLARALGFNVPDTTVTNDLHLAEQFLSGPACVAKPLREALVEGETERIIFTSRVARASLRDARAFGAAPMIIQREITKYADVRVTVVGPRVFAAAIYSQERTETEVDWRRGGTGDLAYQAITLPHHLSDQCTRLVASLGLRFGAIDLVWDKEDIFWFLEVNPNGQWAWIEGRTGQPIAAEIVDALERISGQ